MIEDFKTVVGVLKTPNHYNVYRATVTIAGDECTRFILASFPLAHGDMTVELFAESQAKDYGFEYVGITTEEAK